MCINNNGCECIIDIIIIIIISIIINVCGYY